MGKKSKKSIQTLCVLLFFTLFFSIIIFIVKDYIFISEDIENIEENYIEKSKQISYSDIIEESKIEPPILSVAKNINFAYFPTNFFLQVSKYTSSLEDFFSAKKMQSLFFGIDIELHEKKYDVRWKMKDKILKLFWVKDMKVSEFLGVGIHEFAHFVDIYFLEKKVLSDTSNLFYNISWEKSKIIKPGQKQRDFVSGYAMTNKYEDFAESFSYFVLHNEDFLIKAKKSEYLQQKYDFFWEILFKNDEFLKTDFSLNNKVETYYRDITKIEFSSQKLLHYMKK